MARAAKLRRSRKESESSMSTSRPQGLTLVELVSTLAVLVTLLTVGVPAFAGLQQRIRVATTFHLLSTSLASARIAAVKHGGAVAVCPSSDGRTCHGQPVWDDGWILFRDPANVGQPLAADDVLQVFDGVRGGLALRSTRGRVRVRFTPDGWAYGSNISIRLCDVRGERRHLGSVVVNNAGRTRSERLEATACPF